MFELPAWALFASMPLVAALVGYVTKVLAIEMMFRPVRFVGVAPYLGWQGVIPRNAGRMASVAMDLLLGRLIDPRALVRNIDGAALVAALGEPLERAVGDIADTVLHKYQPHVWYLLPGGLQRRVVRGIREQVPQAVDGLLDDLAEHLDDFVDVRTMAVRGLIEDRVLLNRLIREIARPEFRFIARSGIVFGLAIGVVQAGVWALLHEPLIMPVFGGLVGLTTDWLALKMIFHPRERRSFLGIGWQGLFHKRRQQVAADYGRLIAREVLTADRLVEELVNGPRADLVVALVERHTARLIDEQIRTVRPLVVNTLGNRGLRALQRETATRLLEVARDLEQTEGIRYAERAIDVENTIAGAMQRLTPLEYEGVLRPAFRQDEWKLILCGAVLGVLVGELQVQLFLPH